MVKALKKDLVVLVKENNNTVHQVIPLDEVEGDLRVNISRGVWVYNCVVEGRIGEGIEMDTFEVETNYDLIGVFDRTNNEHFNSIVYLASRETSRIYSSLIED